MSAARAPLYGGFELAGLASSELAAAVRFYGDLLGWQPRSVASGAVTLMRDRELELAVIYPQTPQARRAGVVPHWSPFIAVSEVGAAQALAVSLGAVALRPAFDVAGAGRIAPIADPDGATVSLWAPPAGETPPSGWKRGPCWHELATDDADRARAFYAGLLGWSFQPDDEGATTIRLAGRTIGAIRQSGTSETAVFGWIPGFAVVNLEKSARKAEQLGARRLDATGSQGAVRLADPQGALFALLERGGGER